MARNNDSTTGTSYRYVLRDVRRPLGESPDRFLQQIATRCGCSPADLGDVEILKRSLDARRRRPPVHVMDVLVELASPLPSSSEGFEPYVPVVLPPLPEANPKAKRQTIAIVGAGPCGLFAALALAERGIRAIILERGEPVEQRARTVSRLLRRAQLDPESNFCFGEGGAGTFSDGKLFTRRRGPEVTRVLDMMVQLGAPRDVLIDRHPHLGTDRLIPLLKRIRQHLTERGTSFCFGTRVDTVRSDGRRGILELSDATVIEADRVILAPGGSCRDLFRKLRAGGVAMEAKPFAVGFRIEHPQELIDEIQYGRYARTLPLPPAEYRMTFHEKTGPSRTRGISEKNTQVYTFCMCPGGRVVPTSTCEGEVCTNGMSPSARSGHYANSAVVTAVSPRDLASRGDPVLAGLRFQEQAEKAAYHLGGGEFRAPAARLTDYLHARGSTDVPRTTYRCGVQPSNLDPCYPSFVHERLRLGIRQFEHQMRGYICHQAVVIGVETRTSSPVRILRDRACRSLSHPFLYPGGEGAGWAGGIISSAIDGIRIASAILETP